MRKLILLLVLSWLCNLQGAKVRQSDSITVKLTFDSITHYFYYARLRIENRSSDTFYMPVCQGYEFRRAVLQQFCSYIPAKDTTAIVARPGWERDCNVDTVIRILPHAAINIGWDIRNNSMAQRPIASIGIVLLKPNELHVAGESLDYCSLRLAHTYYSPQFHFPKSMRDKTSRITLDMYRK